MVLSVQKINFFLTQHPQHGIKSAFKIVKSTSRRFLDEIQNTKLPKSTQNPVKKKVILCKFQFSKVQHLITKEELKQ